MPYIREDQKRILDREYPTPLIAYPGEANYLITKMLIKYCKYRGNNYQAMNEVMGIIECVKQEFYRRVVAPYEDRKIKENGDVYDEER